jgi:DNA repair protein RadC
MKHPRQSPKPKPGSPVTRRLVTSVVREDLLTTGALDSPQSVREFWAAVVAARPEHEPDKETLVVILVSARLHPFAWHLVSLGTLNETVAHPREILRPVIAGAAHGFALVHNHPSGDPAPSQADRELTRRIRDAATLLQLRFIDHVIVAEDCRTVPGREPLFSFREAGML